MKKHIGTLLLVIAVVSLISGCAREPKVKIKMKELKVAVVDQNKLWSESKKAKEYQKQLNNKVDKLKEKYNTEIDSLSETEQATKHQEVYQEINQFRQQLKEEFRSDIAKMVKKIAQKKGYNVVLNKDEVRYGGEDITKEVLDEL